MRTGRFIHAALWEIPGFLLQIAVIVSLLVLSYGVATISLLSGIAALIWLKVTQDDAVQDFMKIRADKELFVKVGEWLDRKDAAQSFDEAYAKHLAFYNGVDSDDYMAVTYAKGTINGLRRLSSNLLLLYLLVVIALELL